jgi:hypothetical protein
MNFKSGSTEMTIDPDKFFPLPMNKLKKFTAILSQADYWDSVEYMEQVKGYLKNRLRTLSAKRSFYNNLYMKAKDCDEIDEYYIELQTIAVRKTVDHIAKLQEKVRKNLEYVESL